MKSLILIFLSFSSLAQEERQGQREVLLKEYQIEDISTQELNNFPEIYLGNQPVLQSRSQKTGIYSEPYFTIKDQSRFALGYSLSNDYQQPEKVQSVYATYLNKFNDFYQDLWWAIQAKRTQAHFNAIHDDADSGGREKNLQSFSILGAGVAMSSQAFGRLFNSPRLFEAIAVYFNYNFHQDSTDQEIYRGYGYSADYSLSYRPDNMWFYGGKFSYNWAHVERTGEAEESQLARSLSFGWTSIGFELGFYFD